MNHFIELTEDGKRISINVSFIFKIEELEGSCRLELSPADEINNHIYLCVKESYEEVLSLIRQCATE